MRIRSMVFAHGGLRPLLIGGPLVAVLALAGCSSSKSANDPVKQAQAEVTSKQKALTDAESTLTAKNAEFCKGSTTYITALDRYGDVLHATAPTVGDVKTAGKDLAAPREDAINAGQAATDAQQKVISAQKDLATAEAALAQAQADASSIATTVVATTPSSPAPLAPAATVNRVKQADADFTSAQSGITDQTPLKQASVQFNSAVVALQMSWLKLFADAGCLTDDQQEKAAIAVHDYTAALQQSLAAAGYFQGEVDGVYGPSTVSAVQALQKAHGLPATGAVDRATNAALQSDLQAKGGAAAQASIASTAALQQTLKVAGYWTGPIDGQWTPALTEALQKFQTDLGVEPTGTVDAATISAFEKAIADLKAAASSSPSASPTPSPSPSTKPPTAPSTAAT